MPNNKYMYTDISLNKTELYLLKKGIKIEDIASFTFMQPYKIRARRCKPYWHNLGGTGIFIFTLQSGFVRAIQLAPFQAHKATAILQLLKQHAIPFTNYQPLQTVSDVPVSSRTYHRYSKYMSFSVQGMVWILILLLSMIYALPNIHTLVTYYITIFTIGFTVLSLFFMIYMTFLVQHYLILDSHHMILKGLFHSHVFAYDDIRKLNFDIRATARRDPPLDIEFIDKDFTYHVFATDWIEKCCIDEIVEILKSKGIDTTNSIKFPW